jgi:thiol:disulfide interchange protein DsbD
MTPLRSPASGTLRPSAGIAALLSGMVAFAAAWALPEPAAAQPRPVLAAAAAQTGIQRIDAVEAELVADRVSVRPGGAIDLGLRLKHEPHWHTYWRNPGDSGLPTQIAVTGPDGLRTGAIRWPAPQRLWVGPLANYGYEGEIVLPFTVDMPDTLTGPSVRVEAHAQWLVCREVCIPGEARLAIELPVSAPGAPAAERSVRAALFDAMAARIPDPAKPLAARLHREGGMLSLVFDTPAGGGAIASAEFFPYTEAVVSPPAAQALLRTADGWRIDLVVADGATVPPMLAGLLVVDGRPIDARATAADGSAPGGTPVSVAAEPAGLSRAGGGLLGGGLFGSAPGAIDRGTATGIADGGASAAASGAGLALALLFGAIGGLLLNLMPCVFPVVGLKVLSFAQAADRAEGARRAMRTGALAFAAGVVLSFWLLAGVMLALRAAGESVGWGFQLQSPGFVAAMALLFVAVGLNFSGLFEIGVSLTRLGGVGGSSSTGSFGTGVLAVLVATPCTAPFMGSALGFTLSQPALSTLAVFTAIGLGMAAPYLLLGWFPGWLKRLPRPGRWMVTLREILAFPMYATAAWLAWVLVQQAGADALLRLLLAAVLVGVAGWAWGRFGGTASRRRSVAWALMAVSVAAGAWLLAPLTDPAPPSGAASLPSAGRAAEVQGLSWEPWSEQRVAEAVAQGRPVFVDFTAAWCVTCQANKRLVLDRAQTVEAMRRLDVLALRADWTQRDPAITAALARHQRNGVPLYLAYRGGNMTPTVLPELLTVSLVLEALR